MGVYGNMNVFPKIFQLDLGIYVEKLVNWLTLHFQDLFDALTIGIKWIVSNIQNILGIFPWFIWILLIFLLGWKIKNLKSGLSYGFMVFIIGLLGLWNEMILTLSIVLTAVVLSILIGIPIGIYTAYLQN